MKNLLIVFLLVLMASCKQESSVPKDYALIHGHIKNAKDSIDLRLFDPKTSKSYIIDVDDKGKFKDTLRLENPTTFNVVYDNIFVMYVKNGMDIQMDFDADDIKNSLTFKGEGEEENNFLKFKSKHVSSLFGSDYKNYLSLEEQEFNKTTDKFVDDFNAELDSKSAQLDSSFVAQERAEIVEFRNSMEAQHEEQLQINEKLGPGKPSPLFEDYTNYNGGTSSLADFKGSYVYIDVWATWCVPCIYEIPFLAKVEEQYKGKNIKFVSISADQPKDEGKWRQMIKDKNMKGIQLMADNATESQFLTEYYIYGIPRFILIDPQGNVVSYDAPRPSEDRLKDLLDSLDI